jgi:hypothetical protein
MRFFCILTVGALVFLTGNSHATLIDRGNGLIYDSSLNITWLQNGNLAATSGSSADGLMSWSEANEWATNLVFGGFSDWRLPRTLVPDPTCNRNGSFVTSDNCTGSEMGNLFYNTLGNVSPNSDPTLYGLQNAGPFLNLNRGHGYWSETADPSSSLSAFYFHFDSGFQATSGKDSLHFAIAVRDGNVTSVPEPGTYALMLTGLGFVVWITARRKNERLIILCQG